MAIDDNEDYFRWMHNLKKIADGQKKYDEKIANQTQIDWKFWLAMPTIYDWQAALLAIKLNPDAFLPMRKACVPLFGR